VKGELEVLETVWVLSKRKICRKGVGTMKTCGMMKLWSGIVVVALAGSVCMADDHRWGRGSYHGDRGGCRDEGRRSYHGHYDGGRQYGYSRNPRTELVFGLAGIGIAAAVISSMSRAETVVVSQPVYVQPEPPRVVYVEQPRVIQQPALVTINIQNSNGSFSPVTLRPVGSQWVGPRGEYYDVLPTVGQLRQMYGF
jgi:hypothetical protein